MMTIEEAQAELNELRDLAEQGQGLASARGRIERLYWQVCKKTIRQCNCKNVLEDVLVEIYSKIKYYSTNTKTMEEFKTKARLVAGVVLHWEHSHYTNANLTDDVARAFLAAFPMRTDWFAVLPEKAAEAAPKAVKSESKPTTTPTPKKQSPSKKSKKCKI